MSLEGEPAENMPMNMNNEVIVQDQSQPEDQIEDQKEVQIGGKVESGKRSKVSLIPLSIGLFLLVSSSAALYTGANIYISGLAALNYKNYDGKVLEIIQHSELLGVRKEALLSYQIQGNTIEAAAPVPSSRVMLKGETTAVFADAQNPEHPVLSQEIDYDSVILFGGYGLFVFCFGALVTRKAIS